MEDDRPEEAEKLIRSAFDDEQLKLGMMQLEWEPLQRRLMWMVGTAVAMRKSMVDGGFSPQVADAYLIDWMRLISSVPR